MMVEQNVMKAGVDKRGSDAVKTMYYFITYCIAISNIGCLLTAIAMSLPYLEHLLDVDITQASLIYTCCYFGQLFGSILCGKIASQQIWPHTHLYMAFISMILCIILGTMQYIKSYTIMAIAWFLIGIYVGGLPPMLIIYNFRVYSVQKGPIMLTRMFLAWDIAGATFGFLFNQTNVQYLWYLVIFICVVYSISLVFFLPTPQEYHVIQQLTQQVLDTAQIQVKEQVEFCCIVSFAIVPLFDLYVFCNHYICVIVSRFHKF